MPCGAPIMRTPVIVIVAVIMMVVVVVLLVAVVVVDSGCVCRHGGCVGFIPATCQTSRFCTLQFGH